ncbi:MAG: adenylate kinase [Acidobacteria bacterium]|nr:adenylate kinase [Acidobacteriota bacterium]
MSSESNHSAARAVIFLGPPGAGKGTQAREIAQRLGIPHISTGQMFRDHLGKGTPLGLLAKSFMERGELVSDEVVNQMVRERLAEKDCEPGFLLDGYPRTLAQARALGRILEQNGQGKPLVVNLQLSYNSVVRRLSGRRICPVCQRTYNIFFQPPVQEGICDDDGSPLEQRADDREEAIRERLSAYEAQTSPLIDFYEKQGCFWEVNADQSPERITEALSKLFQDS